MIPCGRGNDNPPAMDVAEALATRLHARLGILHAAALLHDCPTCDVSTRFC